MNALHHPAGNFVYVIVLMCKLQIMLEKELMLTNLLNAAERDQSRRRSCCANYRLMLQNLRCKQLRLC